MRILLIDASPLMFKVFTGPVRDFSTAAGEPTGLRFGFLRSVRAYEKKTKPEKVVVVWDPPGTSSVRENLGESERGYKGNREHTREEAEMIWGGVPKLFEMLSLTKYTQAWAEGYEADDVIGTLARQLAGQGAEVMIHSVDRDLWQLFGHTLIMGWENDKKKGRVIGPAEVIAEFGVAPRHLLFYRAVEGDPSDNLKGIGLTPEERGQVKVWLTGLDLDLDSLDEYSSAMRSDAETGAHEFSRGLYAKVFEDATREKRLRSNYNLMTLQTPPEISLRKGAGDTARLTDLFKALEMNSLLPRVTEFAGEQLTEIL